MRRGQAKPRPCACGMCRAIAPAPFASQKRLAGAPVHRVLTAELGDCQNGILTAGPRARQTQIQIPALPFGKPSNALLIDPTNLVPGVLDWATAGNG